MAWKLHFWKLRGNFAVGNPAISGDYKRGEGFGGQACVLLDLTKGRINITKTRSNGLEFMQVMVCVYALACCSFGHAVNEACCCYGIKRGPGPVCCVVMTSTVIVGFYSTPPETETAKSDVVLPLGTSCFLLKWKRTLHPSGWPCG